MLKPDRPLILPPFGNYYQDQKRTKRISSGQFRQFAPNRIHQRANRLFGKIEADPSRLEQLRQWLGATEFQGIAIVGQSLPPILLGLLPDLKRAELGDAVFNVIEGRVEEV